MRKPYPFYSLLTLGGLLLAGSCSIIAEVDRTKIPTDGGTTPEGGQGSGGTSGAGGSKGGSSGSSGAGGTTGGSAGAAGEGGMGGEPGGGSGGEPGGGSGGEPGGTGGDAGAPPTAECGNGIIETPEQCDDNDTPPAGTDGCDATCQEEPGWNCTMTPSVCVAAACGDRIVAGAELCDDGNNNACGTCSVGCGTSTPAAAATGTITPGAGAPGDLLDGETITLNDGAHPAVVFELDATPGDGVVTGHVAIVFDPAGTAAELQTAIVGAINGVADTTLAITAAPGTAVPNVTLTNQVQGTAGNQTSGETVASATFMISAMAGGAARNCAVGVGCNVGADCLSGTCTANICN